MVAHQATIAERRAGGKKRSKFNLKKFTHTIIPPIVAWDGKKKISRNDVDGASGHTLRIAYLAYWGSDPEIERRAARMHGTCECECNSGVDLNLGNPYTVYEILPLFSTVLPTAVPEICVGSSDNPPTACSREQERMNTTQLLNYSSQDNFPTPVTTMQSKSSCGVFHLHSKAMVTPKASSKALYIPWTAPVIQLWTARDVG
ncbi:hypothetical protein EV421DRAFT_1942569 [Armillaria borealis]|uniref:Uncharacterized protein n=1 Tax=Armillaria borealis TaxID=47425 RepID=A0AA39K4Z2_9AGAR|nr:hypothetical protein EV421DRAFT_1942569 [Armillaria borealis]